MTNMSLKKTTKKVFVVFALTVLLAGVFVPAAQVCAAAYGIVIPEDGVNLRSEPYINPDRPSGNILTAIPHGEKVEILGETTENGYCWYKVRYQSYTGYSVADYIKKKSGTGYVPNEDFEEELANQNFPESYKALLRQLHAQRPNWIFKAGQTGLDWDTVITKEFGTPGVKNRRYSLIHNSFSDSWKSMEKGDYNFTNKAYVSWDSGNYVAASRSIIKYYMDPRNFFDEKYIFQFISSEYDPTLHTSDGLQNMLNGTFMSGEVPGENATYNEILMAAAEESGVSPYTLASMIILEQGTGGGSGSISGKVAGYEGYYNYLNIGATAGGGRDAVENGLIYAKNQGWDTRVKSIKEGAVWYGSQYVKDGQYTQYLKKFNVMNGPDGVPYGQYMTNVRGAYDEGIKIKKAYKSSMDTALVFEIPVYMDMPDTSCPIPSPGNNNNLLDSLSVGAYPLSPAFDRYTYTYNADVGRSAMVTLSAEANDPSAKIEGLGEKTLAPGNNEFDIKVTSTSGEVRSYSINVKSAAGSVDRWIDLPNGRKYQYADGSYATGYTKIGNYYYYFDKDGYMKVGHVVADGQAYQFWFKEGYGRPQGWIKYTTGETAYCLGGGKLATGYTKIGNYYYYFDKDGYMKVGHVVADGQAYQFWFKEGYGRPQGWIKYTTGETAYCLGGGKLATGYTKIGNYYYYFDKDGYMKVGHVVADGQAYQFWFKEGYGRPQGWIKYTTGETAYCLGGGKLAIGSVKIQGKTYSFDSDGYLINQ